MSAAAEELNQALMLMLTMADDFEENNDLDRKRAIEAMALVVKARDRILDCECGVKCCGDIDEARS